MEENRTNKAEIKDFLEVGEQKKDKIETIEKPIHYDDRQYSVKLPKKFLDSIGYKEGDSLLFKLIKPFDINKKPSLKIEYVRKDGTKTNSERNTE